jgi:hypothetical protein
MRSSRLESVIMADFQATEAYASLDLTKAKCSISGLSKVEKKKFIVRISPSNFGAYEQIKST